MKKEYRTEAKYLLNFQEYYVLKNILSEVMTPDQNGSEKGGYTVKSIYFDSVENSSYMEKVDGILERKKIRIRSYGLQESDWVKLEIKNKWNAGIYKEVSGLSKADAEALLRYEAEPLLRYENKAAQKVYRMMKEDIYRPVVAIDYEREAYTLPFYEIRITFDKNLRASVENLKCMDGSRTYFPVLDNTCIILEVKYNYYIPAYIKRILGTVTGVQLSVSKYCMARQLLG
ncbi:MAG: polyphosphate polymerase domain-containing protein [Eubacteriales bacterium]|nr:polyphosphate polymerase domain-containing protein [Eubacteriales bacterium]